MGGHSRGGASVCQTWDIFTIRSQCTGTMITDSGKKCSEADDWSRKITAMREHRFYCSWRPDSEIDPGEKQGPVSLMWIEMFGIFNCISNYGDP